MQEAQIKFECSRPTRRYTESFKKQVVLEYESGDQTKDQLMRKYDLRGKGTVLDWCRKFGKFENPPIDNRDYVMKDAKDKRIRELEKKLKTAEQKLLIYDKLIEVTNRQLDSDIIKKIEARLSESWQQDKK